jgi:hypothetical protein
VVHAAWVNGGGDWFDKNGIFNGPTPTLSGAVGLNTPITLDISGMQGDLLIQGLNRISSVTIDGRAATAFWTDASSNRSQALPSTASRPVFVLNRAQGQRLTITTPSAGTIRVDRVAGPAVSAPPFVGPSNRPDILELEMIDEQTTLAAIGRGNYAAPYAFSPEYRTDPATGLKYLRFSTSTPLASRLISWFLRFPAREEVYARYCVYIEDDVSAGMTEAGMKLSGLSATSDVHWVMEHGPVDQANRNVYSFLDYRYDAQSGPGFGVIEPIGPMLQSGRWYVIEQRGKMNTIGQADGVLQVWLNGHLVWTFDHRMMRSSPAAQFDQFHAQVYHGGVGIPSAPFHYRIAKIAVSSSYIGVPPELVGTQ